MCALVDAHARHGFSVHFDHNKFAGSYAAGVPDLIAELSALSDTTVRTDTPLAPFTTLGVGGTPRAIVQAHTTCAVQGVFGVIDRHGQPAFVLGGGSNLVIDDGDLDVIVVQLPGAGVAYGDVRFDDHVHIDTETGLVHANAGITWDDLVQATIAHGLGGFECLSGIPGSVGATPVQNVGAYGTDIAHILEAVQVYNRDTGAIAWVLPQDLALGYRTSNLKFQDRRIVMAVRFNAFTDGLSAPLHYANLAQACGAQDGERRPAAKVRTVVLAQRRAKGMVYDPHDPDTASAGSFFTNPVVPDLDAVLPRIIAHCGEEIAAAMPTYPAPNGVKLSAAWLIEQAGFTKGWPGYGQATLSTKHTLALTNRGQATTAEIWALADAITQGVEAAFGITLHPEPVPYPPRP